MKFIKSLNILSLTFYLSIFYFFLFLLLRIVLINSYAPDIGGIENNVIYSICKVLYGGMLYDNPEANNFNITQYSPIFYYINIFLCKILGLTPLHNIQGIYILGRTLSLIINLLGGFFIYRLLVKIFGVNKRMSIISAIVYFISLTRIHFSTRPDSLFSLFFILIIYCFAVYFEHQNERKGNVYFFIGLLLSVLSLFVKQNGMQYIGMIPLFFLLVRHYKMFFVSGFILVFFTLTGFVLMYLMYDNDFVTNVYGGLNNGISIPRIYDVFSNFFLSYQLIFILGVYVSFIFFDSKRSMSLRFMSFNVIILFLFAFSTSIKLGSWINYYNEFIIVVIILFTIVLDKYSKEFPVKDNLHKLAGYLLSIYIIVLLPNTIVKKYFHEHTTHLREKAGYLNNKKDVVEFLNSKLKKGEYFLAFDDHISSILADKATMPNKDLVPSQSKFNYKVFDDEYKDGRLKYVVTGAENSILDFMGYDFSKFEKIYQDKAYIVLQNNLPDKVVVP